MADAVGQAAMAFVTQRLVASWLGGATKTSLYPIKVHTSASGLRVYYSLKIIWNAFRDALESTHGRGYAQAASRLPIR